MRSMTSDESVMYQILKNSKSCRDSNWEAVRTFYQAQYVVSLPELRGLPTVWTVERMVRTLKSTYPRELTDPEERQIKAEQETEFKEKARDDNRPVKEEEQLELRWY